MPETSIIVIQCIVKVNSCMGNKFKWSELNQEHALHCSWNLSLTLSNKSNGESLTVQVEKEIKNIKHSSTFFTDIRLTACNILSNMPEICLSVSCMLV